MYILPVASGSSGNSMYVELADVKFLIDVGVSFGRIDERLQEANRNVIALSGSLATL